jgi:hypothetical protein
MKTAGTLLSLRAVDSSSGLMVFPTAWTPVADACRVLQGWISKIHPPFWQYVHHNATNYQPDIIISCM